MGVDNQLLVIDDLGEYGPGPRRELSWTETGIVLDRGGNCPRLGRELSWSRAGINLVRGLGGGNPPLRI